MSRPCLSTLMLTIRHKKTISFVFSFFLIFFQYWCPFESCQILGLTNIQNKFKTWKWKGKHVSFLVTLKWSFLDVLEISIFETKNDFSLHARLHKIDRGYRYMICLVWIYLDLVYQLEFIRYDIWRLCALICFHFSDFFWILCPPICILVKC